MFPPMDANDALERLTQVSDDVGAAVVFERRGTLRVLGSTVPDEDARELAALGDAMLAYGDALREGTQVRQLEAKTPEGGVYVVRSDERAVVATAARDALPGLVQHDLRTVLTDLARRSRTAKKSAGS
jgi:predicted regulator of Ras-like GTPase activity (Roadblock/LC7/MglB family)